MELAPYLYKDTDIQKKIVIFKSLNYKFYDSKSYKEIEDILSYEKYEARIK